MEAWRIDAPAPKLVTQIGCKLHAERAGGGKRWNEDGGNRNAKSLSCNHFSCRAGIELSQPDVPRRPTGLRLA